MEHLHRGIALGNRPLTIKVKYYPFDFGTLDKTCVHDGSPGLCNDCRSDGDRQGWAGFPARMGFDVDEFNDGEYLQLGRLVEVDVFEGMLQSWLWFGILHLCFDGVLDFHWEIFVSTGADGRQYLDSTELYGMLQEWHGTCKRMSSNQLQKYTEYLDKCLLEVRMRMVESLYMHEQEYLPMSLEARCAVIILVETIEAARYQLTSDDAGVDHSILPGSGRTAELLFWRLRELGWCPRQIENLRSNVARYYASLLGPRLQKSLHAGCTEDGCVEAAIDEKLYKPKHVAEECECQHVAVDVDTVIAAISDNTFPAVSFDATTGELRVQRVRLDGKADEAYVAISHVWADGLGNPHRNSIARCCAVDLARMVSAVYLSRRPADNCLWFLDTLCVPVTPEARPYRKKMISMMNSIYRHASAVLVLDGELMQLDHLKDPLELAFRVCTSGWATRIWTTQEAIASDYESTLTIRLKNDKLIEWRPTISSIQASTQALTPKCTPARFFVDNIVNLSCQFDGLLLNEQAEDILNAFSRTSERVTSHAKDELVCVALVAGFPAAHIEKITGCRSLEEQAMEFMMMAKTNLMDITLVEGSRLTVPGFRWCPVRLLTRYAAKSRLSLTLHPRQVTRNGLVGPWMSISFTLNEDKATEAYRDGWWMFSVTGAGIIEPLAVMVSATDYPCFWTDNVGHRLAYLHEPQVPGNVKTGVLVRPEVPDETYDVKPAIFVCRCTRNMYWERILEEDDFIPPAFQMTRQDESMNEMWCIS